MADVGSTISAEELQLATRNHGMPLEALRYPLTPIGLHYLLVHYDIPFLDAGDWRLRVDGRVERAVSLSIDDLRAMPVTTRTVTMECAGNGRALLEPRPISQPWLVEAVGTGEWTGVALADVLGSAGVQEDAVAVVFTGADCGVEGEVEQSYQRALELSVAMSSEAVLAYELNGVPLPPQHGFPLRLVVPGWYGMTNVKWLTTITLTDAPFSGYQQASSYRLRAEPDETGAPVERMLPRSLLAPVGIPDFLTRTRLLQAGTCTLTGRAWSGHGPITGVDVSTDAGATWHAAALAAPALGPHAWQSWQHDWIAAPGEHELCCRATDAAGNVQPLTAEWNLGGYVNNAVHRVPVVVSGE